MLKKTGTTIGDMQGMSPSTWDHGGIVAGLEFMATLQLRTPLRVLRWHGTLHKDRDVPPPCVIEEQWEGVWLIKTKTWKELGGVDIGEFLSSTVASDIGPVNPAEYFPYLLGIHEISESDQPRSSKETALQMFLARLEWDRFNKAHGGARAVIARVLP